MVEFQTGKIFSFASVRFRHDFGGPEGIAAVDQVNPGGEAGQERGLFARAVSSAYHADGNVPVKGAVAGGAGRQPVAYQPFFPRDARGRGRMLV